MTSADRKWYSLVVSDVTGVFVYELRLSEIGSVDFGRWTHRGLLQSTTFGRLPPHLNNHVPHTGNRIEAALPATELEVGEQTNMA